MCLVAGKEVVFWKVVTDVLFVLFYFSCFGVEELCFVGGCSFFCHGFGYAGLDGLGLLFGGGLLGCELEGFLHGGGAFLDGSPGAGEVVEEVGGDFLEGGDAAVGEELLFGDVDFCEVGYAALEACFDGEGFALADVAYFVDYFLGDGAWDDFEDGVAEGDGGGGVAGDHLHVLGVGAALFVGDASFDFDGYGYVGLEVVADALCGDGLAVVADDACLHAEVAPGCGDDFCESDGDAFNLVGIGVASTEDVETLFGSGLVHGGECFDGVEGEGDVARIGFCGGDLDVHFGAGLGGEEFALVDVDYFYFHDCVLLDCYYFIGCCCCRRWLLRRPIR